MSEESRKEQERRKFVRLDLTENVRAITNDDRDIGRVEKVGAGGMQIRLNDAESTDNYKPGSRLHIKVVEPGNVQQQFDIEVRVCEGKILGVQFLN